MPDPRLLFEGDAGDFVNEVDLSNTAVSEKLMKLNPEKSPGVDHIYPVVLKRLALVISVPLSVIFCESFVTGIVPKEWKLANVTAIFKKGLKNQVGNYRPISLTSQVCKVMEMLVRDTITEHLKKYKLIKDSQFGFTKGSSCLGNLLKFLEEVTRYVEEGYPLDVIYLDFSKAFDRVPHQRLILKIKAHGVGDRIVNWIEDWLRSRRQRVVVGGCESQWQPVRSGVPQGSVLGPLLFIIYINDIDGGVVSSVLKFADDTKIYRAVRSHEDIEQLQRDLSNMYEWSKEWQMLFNVEKCKCLHIGYNNVRHQYTLGNGNVENSTEERDLGVRIQENLDVGAQVAESVKKANRMLGMISRTYDDKSISTMLQLYKSLVRPHLEYAIQAWRPFKQKDIDSMEKVQRRATRMMGGLNGYSYEERLEIVNLLSLEMRRLRSDLIEVFKIMNGFEGLSVEEFFELSDVVRTRGHSKKIYKLRSRLDVRKYFFTQRIVEEWNNLPPEVVESKTINEFKSKIDPLFRGVRGTCISQKRLPTPVLRPARECS